MGCNNSLSASHSHSSVHRVPRPNTGSSLLDDYPELAVSFQLAQNSKNSTRLLLCVRLTDPVWGFRPCPRRAQQPRTVGCVALALLNSLLRKQRCVLREPDLIELTPWLISALLESDEALKEHTLYFISKTLCLEFSEYPECLVNSGAVPLLSRFWYIANELVQQRLIRIVQALTLRSELARQDLAQAGGIGWLFRHLQNTGFRGQKSKPVLATVMSLLQSSDEQIKQAVVDHVDKTVFKHFELRSLALPECEAFNQFSEAILHVRQSQPVNTSFVDALKLI